MNRYGLVAGVLAAVAMVACTTASTNDPQASGENKQDKAYVTGSRLPVRDGSGSSDVKSVGNRQDIDSMSRSQVNSPPKGGGM